MAALHRSLADRCWALERWLLLTSKGNSAEVHSSRDSLHQAKGKGCHGDCSASANGTYRVPALCCLGQHSLMEVMEPYWSNINFIWVWEAYSHSSWIPFCFPSVQFSRSVVSNSLHPHGLQHTRPPCPSPTPGACSNSCPLSWWCHPTISSSVVPFSSRLQSFPASGSFPMSQLFAWGNLSIGVSASTSVPPMSTQDWSPLGWTGWISSKSKGLSRVFSNTTVQKHQFFSAQPSL